MDIVGTILEMFYSGTVEYSSLTFTGGMHMVLTEQEWQDLIKWINGGKL